MNINLSDERLSTEHMVGISDLQRSDIELILNRAAIFSEINERDLKKVPFLRGVTVANLFFESSTRTRISFELAEKRLSADVINFSAHQSSLSKGESLIDTAQNIEAMKPNLVVVRHKRAGVPTLLKEVMSGAIVNAGDGSHEHPTQALLDAYTLLQYFKRTPSEGLKAVSVAIVGDILHSRVARSNIYCLQKLGAKVVVVAPRSMMPAGIDRLGVEAVNSLEGIIGRVDAIMMLRIQNERLEGMPIASEREYARCFGMTKDRYYRCFDGLPILHPGPLNRGVEIDSEIADGKSSLILEQAKNGIAVRMAVLYSLMLDRMGN